MVGPKNDAAQPEFGVVCQADGSVDIGTLQEGNDRSEDPFPRRSVTSTFCARRISVRGLPDYEQAVLTAAIEHGNKIVLIFDGYNKKKDSSKKRQNKAIYQARAKLGMWKRRRRG